MSKEMKLRMEKELELGNSGITIPIYEDGTKLGRLEINRGRFRFFEPNRGNENLVLTISELLDLLRNHPEYKK